MKELIKNKFSIGVGLTGIFMLASPLALQAQGSAASQAGSFTHNELMLGLALFLTVALLFATLGLVAAVISLRSLLLPKLQGSTSITAGATDTQTAQGSFWEKLQYRLTDAVPLDREAEVMTDHEYDGIRELDNSLPPWWKAMFLATIVFSVIYLAVYHVFDWGELQDQEYETELAEAKLRIDAYMASKGGALNENNVELLTDESLLAKGKAIYEANCAACHGMELQGTVGPNLADSYWVHGGSIGDVFKTIRDGVPSKGMISWKNQLSPEQIQQVSSYIISMEGSNPPNAKEPQGDLFER